MKNAERRSGNDPEGRIATSSFCVLRSKEAPGRGAIRRRRPGLDRTRLAGLFRRRAEALAGRFHQFFVTLAGLRPSIGLQRHGAFALPFAGVLARMSAAAPLAFAGI